MHQSSFDKMTAFRRDYLEARRAEPLVIVDLGSQDINGCYRPLFALPPWKYVGVDLAPGLNVDVVLSDPYDWREISPESVDVIVAGQTFDREILVHGVVTVLDVRSAVFAELDLKLDLSVGA